MRSKPVAELKNIGEKTAVWLADVGVRSKADLAAMGAVEAYWLIKQQRREITAVLLYALHGALHNVHWNALSPETKAQLRADADQFRFIQP